MGVSALGMALKYALSGDDDEDDKKYYLNYMLNVSFRIEQDILFYLDPKTFTQLARNPLPIIKSFTDAGEWLSAASRFVAGDDTINSGINEGGSRLGRETMQFLPVLSKIHSTRSAAMQRYEDVLDYAPKK